MAKATVGSIIIDLEARTAQFTDGLNRAQMKAKTTTGAMMGHFRGLGPVIAGAFSIAAITQFGRATIDAYAEQERASKTLAAAMQQAGTYTDAAFRHNLEYASSLQKLTTYGDEAITGVQKMLTNFGVEGEMLDKLTRSTLDLAAAKGMDLKSAADLVAKSVGSSTNALTRYGIEVKGAAGSTERMQTAADNITKLFGGAAAAEASAYTGKVQQMKNAVGDLQEEIGKKLVPTLATLAEKLTTVAEATTGFLTRNDAPFSATVNYLKEQIVMLERETAAMDAAFDGARIEEYNRRIADLQEGLAEALKLQKGIGEGKGKGPKPVVEGENWQQQAQLNQMGLDTWYLRDKDTDAVAARGEIVAEEIALEQEKWDQIFEIHQGHADREMELNDAVKENLVDNMRTMQSVQADYYSAWASLASGIAGIVGKENKAVFLGMKAFEMAATWINALAAQQLAEATIPPPAGEVVGAARLAAGKIRMAAIAATAIAGMRAEGGPVTAGESYIVGERGPEILTMGNNGFVTSNEDAFSGGGDTYHVAVSINATDADSFERLTSRNPDAITEPIIQALRRGNSRMIEAVRGVM